MHTGVHGDAEAMSVEYPLVHVNQLPQVVYQVCTYCITLGAHVPLDLK